MQPSNQGRDGHKRVSGLLCESLRGLWFLCAPERLHHSQFYLFSMFLQIAHSSRMFCQFYQRELIQVNPLTWKKLCGYVSSNHTPQQPPPGVWSRPQLRLNGQEVHRVCTLGKWEKLPGAFKSRWRICYPETCRDQFLNMVQKKKGQSNMENVSHFTRRLHSVMSDIWKYLCSASSSLHQGESSQWRKSVHGIAASFWLCHQPESEDRNGSSRCLLPLAGIRAVKLLLLWKGKEEENQWHDFVR